MANSRIRYEKFDDPNGKYDKVSVRNYHSSTTDAMYIVYLDTNNMNYEIKNMTTYRKYTLDDEKVELNNLHVLKRHVKSRLQKLGVKFDSEIRDNSSRIPGENCSYKKNKDELKNDS